MNIVTRQGIKLRHLCVQCWIAQAFSYNQVFYKSVLYKHTIRKKANVGLDMNCLVISKLSKNITFSIRTVDIDYIYIFLKNQ